MPSSVMIIVPSDVREWITGQTRAGASPAVLLHLMLQNGWQHEQATAALQTVLEEIHRPVASSPAAAPTNHQRESAGPVLAPPATAGAVPGPDLSQSPAAVDVHGHKVRILLEMKHPRVVVFGDLLSQEECDALREMATARLSRSTTVQNATGGTEVHAARTSDGMFFQRGENDLCQRIEQRIAVLLNWPVENGEGLQVLRYRPGAEYLPHYDYFDPVHAGTAKILQRGGQRVGTLVMYLNTPERGGATTFPDVGLDVTAQKGNAVFFSYERPHPDTRTLHGGAPVLEGEKWVATKWMRQGEFR